MLLQAFFEELAAGAMERTQGARVPPLVRVADPAHGDYQVNGVMGLAKQLGKNPRELAEPVAKALAEHEAVASAEVAGPGFINLKLRPEWLAHALLEVARDVERDGVPVASKRERIVVDYSGPNIAKEMHVGHIRSTIIGAAVYSLLKFLGHDVLGDNHVGDWGKQFGLLIVGMRRFGDEAALATHPIQELDRIYKLSNATAEAEPAFADAARAELHKLQHGDAENLALWKRFAAATRSELERIYGRLGVRFDLWRGESAYEAELPGVVQMLIERGLAREDDGAICVFFDDDPALGKSPFIVRKKDGAYLYSTTDIATVLYRRDELKAERSIYVVDQRQKQHFQQLFATVRKLGVTMALEHVGFGTVFGKDGKPLKARAGEMIKLSDLLDEAEKRAADLFVQEAIEVEPERVDELARAVGIGAVKYADLSQNRLSDYRFDWDKLISFKGNSSPYLQYAHARVCAIFRKGEVDVAHIATADAQPPQLVHAAEVALGLQLLRFADVLHDAARTHEPHILCEHLFTLAQKFSTFFEHCPVLKADEPERRSRLLLCWLTQRQLARGLTLLGIDAPQRM
jgi:arginyl-tRNA synthetase